MIENDRPVERRVRVTREDVPGSPPWRAVIAAVETDELKVPEVPVGRFATHAEAVTTACTALRFLAAGIPWRVQP